MNNFRVDALSLLTGEEPEEGMFVDWMLCAIFSSSIFPSFRFLSIECCELMCQMQG